MYSEPFIHTSSMEANLVYIQEWEQWRRLNMRIMALFESNVLTRGALQVSSRRKQGKTDFGET